MSYRFFYFCIRDISNLKSIDDYIFYIKHKSKATYLIGQILGQSKNPDDMFKDKQKKILSDISDIKDKRFIFEFILWFENMQDIKKIKKIDKLIGIMGVNSPLSTMCLYKKKFNCSAENFYYEIGKPPKFLYDRDDLNLKQVYHHYYDNEQDVVDFISPLYNEELYSELFDKK